MNFYEIVKKLLKERNCSINKMATDLDIGGGTFSTWETRNTVPNGDILSRMADYFGVTVDFLLGREKKPSVQQAEIGDDDLAELISIYRLLDERGKGKLLGYAESLKPAVIEKKADIPVNRADIPADSLLSVARR